jgi:hypothetical protein
MCWSSLLSNKGAINEVSDNSFCASCGTENLPATNRFRELSLERPLAEAFVSVSAMLRKLLSDSQSRGSHYGRAAPLAEEFLSLIGFATSRSGLSRMPIDQFLESLAITPSPTPNPSAAARKVFE